MKVLFLDVDGVLNRLSFGPMESEGLRSWIEPALAARLDAVCAATGAQLVMSSDWRRGNTLEELRAHLGAAGVTTPLLATTPILHRGRWKEIAAWLDEWKRGGGEEVERFAIVDDGFGMGELEAHFVRTSPQHGLDEYAAAALIELLGPSCR